MARYGLDLQQKNKANRRKKQKSALIIAFVCFALVLGTASFLIMWRHYNYDFNNIFNKENESTTSTASATTPQQNTYSGTYTFLLTVTDDKKVEPLFFNLIRVDLSSKVIKVVPVDGSFRDTATGLNAAQTLSQNGISALRDMFERKYFAEIDRYVLLTEGDYKSLFRYMGNITVTLNSSVEYDTEDMFLELQKGENVLTPDKTYKYMKYLCETYTGYERSQLNADIVVASFNAFYTAEAFAKSDTIFSNVINYCTTDITVVDFTNAKEELQYLLPETSKDKLKVFVSANLTDEVNS